MSSRGGSSNISRWFFSWPWVVFTHIHCCVPSWIFTEILFRFLRFPLYKALSSMVLCSVNPQYSRLNEKLCFFNSRRLASSQLFLSVSQPRDHPDSKPGQLGGSAMCFTSLKDDQFFLAWCPMSWKITVTYSSSDFLVASGERINLVPVTLSWLKADVKIRNLKATLWPWC